MDVLTEDQSRRESYDESQIQVLEGLEAVRKRPGMYIGTTGPRGLHHLVWEVVDNSIDEALAGFCDKIEVMITKDGGITVRDNGRGIPVGIQEKVGRPALEVIMTVLHAGGKFGDGGYKVSGGLHGVGASVVNALSTKCWVKVYREGHVYFQEYHRGVPVADLEVIGDSKFNGTETHFVPDPEIFTETTVFEFDILAARLRELAFLNKGIRIIIRDERDEEEKKVEYHYEGGIKSFVTYLNRTEDVLHEEPIYIEAEKDDISVEIAMQYNDGFACKLYSFANNIHTHEGGTHEYGFKVALTRIINDYARKNQIFKDNDQNLTGDDVREGLTAIVSIKHPDPQFEGQTKTKLGNSEARTITETLFAEAFSRFLFENPDVAKYLNRSRLLKILDIGGVRLEDNVIVTQDGIENLTAVPK